MASKRKVLQLFKAMGMRQRLEALRDDVLERGEAVVDDEDSRENLAVVRLNLEDWPTHIEKTLLDVCKAQYTNAECDAVIALLMSPGYVNAMSMLDNASQKAETLLGTKLLQLREAALTDTGPYLH